MIVLCSTVDTGYVYPVCISAGNSVISTASIGKHHAIAPRFLPWNR